MTRLADEARAKELQDILAELPSFVKPGILPPATEPLTLDHFNFWSPERTGDLAVDYEWGGRHFLTALNYSGMAESALLLFLVVMAMNRQPIGAIECGFIDAASRSALAGMIPPKAPDEYVAIVSRTPGEAESSRANETAMASAISLSRAQFPTLAAYILSDLLTTDRGPIHLAIWLVAGAALNGSKY